MPYAAVVAITEQKGNHANGVAKERESRSTRLTDISDGRSVSKNTTSQTPEKCGYSLGLQHDASSTYP